MIIRKIFFIIACILLAGLNACAIGKPLHANVAEVARDGDFIAYSDNTVIDTRNNLMWAASDNGKPVDWYEAKEYCETFRSGGYGNWRLPTATELRTLFYSEKLNRQGNHLTGLISLSSYLLWSADGYDKVKSFGNKDVAILLRFDQHYDAGAELIGYKSKRDEQISERATVYRVLPVRSLQ